MKETQHSPSDLPIMLVCCPRCRHPRADAFPSQDVLMRYLRDNRNNRACREENGQCVLMVARLEE